MATPPVLPLKFLLLEESEAEAEIIQTLLAGSHFEIQLSRQATLGTAGAAIRREAFDLVLCGQHFAGGQSTQVLAILQANGRECPVIVFAASEAEKLPPESLPDGIFDCLVRPGLNSAELDKAICQSLRTAAERQKRKLAEARLDEKSRLLNSIFEVTDEALLILTENYLIQSANPAAASLLDSTEEALVGETFPFEINPIGSTELEIPDRAGHTRTILLSSIEMGAESGLRLLVRMKDVTDEYAIRRDLDLEQKRLAMTLDSINDAVITSDSQNRVEQLNQRACELTGFTSGEARGRVLGEVLRLKHPTTGAFLQGGCIELLERAFLEVHNRVGITLEPLRGGDARLVTAEMRRLEDEAGEPQGCVTILRDVTQQRRAEAEIFKSEKLHSIALMAGGIAHDFNNILSSILGNLSIVLMETEEGSETYLKLNAAEKAALQAKSLTQQLLTFARGGAPVLEVTTVKNLVKECALFVMRGSNVKCKITCVNDLWHVDADEGQISQVIINLIINADQAMPDGGTIELNLDNVVVAKGAVKGLEPGNYVTIEVKDSGIGIPPESIDRVFDPYFTTKEKGNGLGLASSYSIVRGHRGMITVHSTLGSGSSFIVYLPKSPKAPAAEAKQAEIPEKAEAKPGAESKRSYRILVMDDMEDMMHVAGEILTALGHEVECTADGAAAIEAYKHAKENGKPFDAVVFDLTVPGGIGGEEASEILLAYDPELKAIASSGYTNSNIMTDFSDSAFSAVVPKPYRISEMREALKRVLG